MGLKRVNGNRATTIRPTNLSSKSKDCSSMMDGTTLAAPSTRKAIFSSAFARKQNEAVLKARAKQPPYKSSLLRELVRTAQRSVKLAE